MAWNWQQPDWPQFRWEPGLFDQAEEGFLRAAGMIRGTVKHLGSEDHDRLVVEVIGNEAITTSAIEGEVLNRDSVQSSIRRQLGLSSDNRRVQPAERGISELMADLFRNHTQPLDHATLFRWHRMLMAGRTDLRDVGCYRTHAEPMQIVSGAIHDPKVHFEAPPSERVPAEMDAFVTWFNRSAPKGQEPLRLLERAALSHLYFESIHPFEDGNGRIGRAIAEFAIANHLGEASLTALAATIALYRADYYRALEKAQRGNDANEWMRWFAGIALEAQQRTLAHVEFLIDKTKLLDRLRGQLNPRQEAAMVRVLREGPEGFKGGLSASNYQSITKASAPTATRDLAELVTLGALTRTGEKKSTRYHLTIPLRPVGRVTIGPSGAVVQEPIGV